MTHDEIIQQALEKKTLYLPCDPLCEKNYPELWKLLITSKDAKGEFIARWSISIRVEGAGYAVSVTHGEQGVSIRTGCREVHEAFKALEDALHDPGQYATMWKKPRNEKNGKDKKLS